MHSRTIVILPILWGIHLSLFAVENLSLTQGNLVQDPAMTAGNELVRPNGAPMRVKGESEGIQGCSLAVSMNGLSLDWHGIQGMELSIPGIEAPLTQQYIKQYTSSAGLEWLRAVMARGKMYLPFIRQEVEAMNLPSELAYLPVIESAFLPTAVSRSGAVGLWQFMKNSIHGYGMVIDEWRDDRRDIIKSTRGALQKLRDNYRYFQDWPLALAAYNAGLGAIQRAVQKTGTKDYWLLSEKKYLKAETTHYVPKFLAVAYILTNPGKYGIETDWGEVPAIEQIPVGRMADLRLIEKRAGIEQGLLRALNPELYYGITPRDQKYKLKIPAEYKESVTAVLAKKDEPLVLYYYHTIHSGDTLSALSRHYGVSVEQIKQANPGIQDRYLQLGKKIKIPALKNVGPYERPLTATSIAFKGSHTVKKGETLWSIALSYEVDPETLATVNGLTLSSILREGSVLKTPIKKAETHQ